MPRYLQKRRRRWYAVLDIPKGLRAKFGGQPRFVQSLQTEGLTEAETRVHGVIAIWKAQIAAARGAPPSLGFDPIQKALAWREDLWRAENDPDQHFAVESLIDDEMWCVSAKDDAVAQVMSKVAYGKSYPLDRDIEAWLATQELESKTIDMKRTDARRFAAKFKFSHEVTRQALQGWVHNLQVVDGLKSATIRRIVSACRGYWNYLHIVGQLRDAENVFDRVAPKKISKSKSATQKKRQAFDSSDLPKLVVGALNRGDLQLAQLIWMGIWTGCRIEELCALKISDVRSDHFLVVDAKTPAGFRAVPLHPRLEPLMRHLCANSADGYVLSGLSFNKYDDRSNAIGKRFGRLKTALGFDERYVFHSLRKTVATELENQGVPENVAADIVGHEKKTMTYGVYSGGNRLKTLKAAIRKLAFKFDPEIERELYRVERKVKLFEAGS